MAKTPVVVGTDENADAAHQMGHAAREQMGRSLDQLKGRNEKLLAANLELDAALKDAEKKLAEREGYWKELHERVTGQLEARAKAAEKLLGQTKRLLGGIET